MLDQLRDHWRVHERAVPISPVPRFAPEGLVIGAGTVLLAADAMRRLERVEGQEARVLTLLGAGYARAISSSVLGNIERAAKAWNQGDDCLAYIHLIHGGLGELPDPHQAARRLSIVDACLKAGTRPHAAFAALKLDASSLDAIEKAYDEAEARVPPGSGRTSGEWTRDGGAVGPGVIGYLAPGAAAWLAEIAPAAAASLGEFAAGFVAAAGGAVLAFGLLFVPSPNKKTGVEGDVKGVPGLRYAWGEDAVLHFTYDAPDGTRRTFTAQLKGDVLRDVDGRVVGRLLPDGTIAFDPAAIAANLGKEDEPRICPAPAKDVAGSHQGKTEDQSKSLQYENYVKRMINPPPDGPTPSGFVYYLPSAAENGKPVSYDDCQKASGVLVEIKGEGYTKLTNDLPKVMAAKFVGQATRQLEASGGRPVVWVFAEPEAAEFARELFKSKRGLEGITVVCIPWTRSERK